MTDYGQNLWNISSKCGVPRGKLDLNAVKRDFKYADVPEHETWRSDVIKDMLEVKWNEAEFENLEVECDELNDLLINLCVT